MASARSSSVGAEWVWALGAMLGESPLWSTVENAVYFLDIEAPAIHRLGALGEHASWTMPAKVGTIGHHLDRGLIAAFEDGVFAMDLSTGVRRPLPITTHCPTRPSKLTFPKADAL